MKVVFLNTERFNYDKKIDLPDSDSITYYSNTTSDNLLNHISNNEIIVIKELMLDKETINKFPDTVKMICEAGTGYNNIDIDACKKRNIKVCNVPSYATISVATFTMMLILSISCSLNKQISMLKDLDYSNFGNKLFVKYNDIHNKTLGIIGFGKIGSEVARLAIAFGMNVCVYTRNIKETNLNVKYVSLEELLKNSDYISLNCSLNDESFHIINKNNISLIKKSAYIINTARGALIEEKSLIEALKNDEIAGAALDVLENETVITDNELFKLENVIITPHMAWNSFEARNRLLNEVFNNIKAFEEGEIINSVY